MSIHDSYHGLGYQEFCQQSYQNSLIGLESASEQGSFSSEFSSHSLEERRPQNSFERSPLSGLEGGQPWNAAVVIRNIESVASESRAVELDKLLTVTDFYEQKIASHPTTARPEQLAERALKLYALCHLVEKIQERWNLRPINLRPSQPSESKPSAAWGVWGMLPAIPFVKKNSSSNLVSQDTLVFDIRELEWTLPTIQKFSSHLNEFSDPAVQELSSLVVDQICHLSVAQERDIKALERERLYLVNLALLKTLKTHTIERIKAIAQKESADLPAGDL